MPQWVVGFGCQRGCPVEELDALLMQVLEQFHLHLDDVVGLATLDRKLDEPGLLELAQRLGCPLRGYSAVALAPLAQRLSHHSSVAMRHTGCLGVAESAALALADRLANRPAHLHVTRQKSRHATLAIAQLPCSGAS